MNDEGATTRLRHRTDEIAHEAVVLDLVDTDAVLHRHRQLCRVSDRAHARRNQHRLRHQAGAESTALDTLARAADVEIDLVVAVALAELRALREVSGLTAAELQSDRMFLVTEGEVPIDIAMDERAGGDHLGVKARLRGNLAHEIAVV